MLKQMKTYKTSMLFLSHQSIEIFFTKNTYKPLFMNKSFNSRYFLKTQVIWYSC